MPVRPYYRRFLLGAKCRPYTKVIEQVVSDLLHIRGLRPLLVFFFRVEEKFAGGKFREIPFAVDIYFAGGKFRAKSKIREYSKNFLHAKNMCYTYTVCE